MKMTVLRPFWWAGEPQAVGAEVDVPNPVQAAELRNAGKAAPVPEPEPEPEPAHPAEPPAQARKSGGKAKG